MEIRGERECQGCGARWSYYETGSVECPDCGSVRSVGVDERTLHTATGADLDLTEARAAAESTREAAAAAAEAARRYVRRRGFVAGGDLQPLDPEFVRGHEIRAVGGELRRALDPDEAAEAHFLALLDGEDPAPPDSLRGPYGLARAGAAAGYCEDVSAWLDSRDEDGETRRALEAIRERRKRVEALDGDVPPGEADALVAAARTLGAALRGDGATVSDAREALR